MRFFLCFLSVAFLLFACGRAENDDTVGVSLSIKNHSQESIYVETNFPVDLSADAKPSEGILPFHTGLQLFSWWPMRRIRTYQDFVDQFLSSYPDARIWIYSVDEDNEKDELLLSCSLAEFPAITWSEDHGKLHFNTNHYEYPWNIWFGAVWKNNQLAGKFEREEEN